MNRYFPIFHGLHERAPWGVAVEREPSASAGEPKTRLPRAELLMLCRTEAEAKQHAEHVSLGQSLKDFRAKKLADQKGGQ
ncbi:MAG: hypothetical protein RLY20_2239 [Verrucomicrobiota bacterium]|jgi:hypothetical protein